MPIIRLEKLLKSSTGGRLQKLVRNAQHMDELTSTIRKGLQPELAAQLLAASVSRNGRLSIIASSSAWAAKFRFETEQLMQLARHSGAKINACTVTVSKRERC